MADRSFCDHVKLGFTSIAVDGEEPVALCGSSSFSERSCSHNSPQSPTSGDGLLQANVFVVEHLSA